MLQSLMTALAIGAGLLLFSLGAPVERAPAADHGDAPRVSNEQGADIADVYAFLDPNDNNMLTMIITARGFIVPGEAENLGFFQEDLNWRFAIENSGDAGADMNIEVVFSPRTGFLDPQTATVSLRTGSTPGPSFTAPTTVSNARSDTPNPFVVTTDSATGIQFFAGMVDDPFFFDVPAELLYRQSLIDDAKDPTVFLRGRDTFAGYNVMAVALNVPIGLLMGSDSTVVGVSGYTELRQGTKRSRFLGLREKGAFVNIDRMGIPAINTVLVNYPRKDEYNRSSTTQDASNGQGFTDELVASLQALQTSDDNIALLGDLVIFNGDLLRVDTAIANTGNGGGDNAAAGFPNGRRLQDDVIDVIVRIISNGEVFPGDGPGDPVDNVDANDRSFADSFPFLAEPHQPRDSGTDDGTRN